MNNFFCYIIICEKIYWCAKICKKKKKTKKEKDVIFIYNIFITFSYSWNVYYKYFSLYLHFASFDHCFYSPKSKNKKQ